SSSSSSLAHSFHGWPKRAVVDVLRIVWRTSGYLEAVFLLAVDEAGAFVIFELKRARTPDKAIGRLAPYMGWLKETIGKDCELRGVIVAKHVTDHLRYAV